MKGRLRSAYDDVINRLRKVRQRKIRVHLLSGACFWILGALVLSVLSLLAEAILHLEPFGRTLLYWGLVTGIVTLFLFHLGRPLLILLGFKRDTDEFAVAQEVGEKFPSVKDHLLNALQLLIDPEGSRYYSSDFIEAAFEDAQKEIQPFDIESVADFSPARKAARAATGGIIVSALLVVLFPSTFLAALDRLSSYDQSFVAPSPFTLVVKPGNIEVVKGERVQIEVRVEGEPRSTIVLARRPEQQQEFETIELRPSADGIFRHEIPSVKLSTIYHAMSGSVKSEDYKLSVIDRPAIAMFRLTLTPPLYSRIRSYELDDNVGDVTALKGTQIAFTVEANKSLSEAALVLDDGHEVVLTVEGSKATGELRLMKETSYRFHLLDNEGLEDADPINYELKVLSDNSPRAVIELPGANLDVAGNEDLNMLFRITDDYGFSRLRLAHRLIHSKYEAPAEEYSIIDIPLPPQVGTERLVPFTWHLPSLNLVPEDVMSYYLEVFDNDDVSGPKSGRSEEYTLRLPSLDEVFAEIDQGHETSQETLEQARQEAEKASQELEELEKDLTKDRQLEWAEKKKAEELIGKYKDLQQKIGDVSRSLEQMIQQMQQNQLLSPETLEKYLELQKLMEELNSPELAEALKQLQESLGQLNPEALKEAMKQFQFSEEQFRRSLERTINLLKRIHIEQKIDEAVRRTEELLEEQTELRKQTEEAKKDNSSKANELGDRQEELAKQLDQLRKDLESLQKMMEEFPSEMPLEEMDQAMSDLDSSGVSDQMSMAGQQLRQQQMNEAMKGQQQAMQNLGRFLESMQQMQDMLRQNLQQQIVNEMRKAYHDLLELSEREEGLKEQTEQFEQQSSRFREGISDQMEVSRDLVRVAERLAAVAQKTFGVTPEMGKAMGDAMRSMNDAMESLGQRNAAAASEEQKAAMAALNEAATLVQGSLNAMMQGAGQGLGMAGFMQRLQGLTGMQQGINRGTQHLGGLGDQRAAEMARLAGEQGMVRKSLEQLSREASQSGEMSKLLGDLNRIAMDMREVQTDLAQGNVRPETIRKQERILSRLLDSQRSMRERDYEKQRRAETGREYKRESLPPGISPVVTDREKLRRDLLKALEEGYTKDYESLIKRYFELLESDDSPQ
jgi:ABC-type transporter Mla subunit MlaD